MEPQIPNRPNILWFTTDQQRYDTIGALGNAHVSTATIDGLVHGGTAFVRAYCQSPICTPSRSSFLTGMYPSSIRANRNGNAEFSDAAPLVTRLLAEAGYVCGNVGKLHLATAYHAPEKRVNDGYSYMAYSISPRESSGYDYSDWVRAQGASLEAYAAGPEPIPDSLHQTRWCADRAIDFIADNIHLPWLLTINPFDPHPPFDPPMDYLAQFDPEEMPGPLFRDSDLVTQKALAAVDFQTHPRPPAQVKDSRNELVRYAGAGALGLNEDVRRLQAAYYAMIKVIDDHLARILDKLEQTGQRDATLVIFTSYHGVMVGDHGLLLSGPRIFEGLVRVPLIMSWPGVIAADIQREGLVELTDIAPTILDFCGIEVPAAMQGRSLRPLLAGGEEKPHRSFVRSEYIDAVELRTKTRATMYRDGRYKLVVYHDQGLGELYDLARDPDEFDNLWDSPEHAGIKLALMEQSFNAAMMALDTGPDRVAPW
jgi:arylsulfatase A-like enzyme